MRKLKHVNLFENFSINENIDFGNKNKTYKIQITKERLPELILSLAGELDSIKIMDQHSIKVQKIEKGLFSGVSGIFYIICTVSAPGHEFAHREKIINGKKVFTKPFDDVRIEVKISK
jgi:hypothetical protein